MVLADRVHVAGRYRRAIRLEADLGDASALEGFICSRSSADVLESLARHVLDTDQCAFTWTGPYGGGKSSLAVALGSLLGGSPKAQAGGRSHCGKADHAAPVQGPAGTKPGLAHSPDHRAARRARTSNWRGH